MMDGGARVLVRRQTLNWAVVETVDGGIEDEVRREAIPGVDSGSPWWLAAR